MKLDHAIDGLKIALDEHDAEVRYQASIEGENAEIWDELEVNAEAVRTVLNALSAFTDGGRSSDALNSASDLLRQKQKQPYNSVQQNLWEAIKDYAERSMG